tara:strand:+ start:10222 stop:10752 length:531 start_codon:yes stop_codon:yes gene_type:complete
MKFIFMETNLKSNSIDLGIKLGTFLFIVTAVIYIIDGKLFTNFSTMLAYMIPSLSVSIYSVLSARKLQNQIISFKEAFTAYFLCIAVGYLISTIGSIIIFKFIDPAAADLIHEEIMISTKEMLENFGTPSEIINEAMNEMEKNHSFSYSAIFQNYANVLLRNAIFGLLVAVTLKKS